MPVVSGAPGSLWGSRALGEQGLANCPAEQEWGFGACLEGMETDCSPSACPALFFLARRPLGRVGNAGLGYAREGLGSPSRSDGGGAMTTALQAHRLSAESGPIFKGYLNTPRSPGSPLSTCV